MVNSGLLKTTESLQVRTTDNEERLSQFLQNALSVTAIDAKANSSASKTAV
jgi:hypothetical protein